MQLSLSKCVQRELWSGSACRRTTIDYLCDQWCVWPKMWWSNKRWVVRCLSWKTISVPWFGRDYWHGGRAGYSNKRANNAKYSNCKGLNHETYDVSLQNFAIAAIFNFVSTSNFISIHSPSFYKQSMISFVHKVQLDVDFQITHRLYALFML